MRSAPTWDGESGKGGKILRQDDEQGNEDPRGEDAEGMMLVIDGMERPIADEGEEARHDEDNRDVEDLVEEFGRVMDGLRGVVTAWEGWKHIKGSNS